MKKISTKNPSYFEGMKIGDRVDLFKSSDSRLSFVKTSNDSGNLELISNNSLVSEMEINYDFENFPTSKDSFIKKIKYLALNDIFKDEPHIDMLKNDDLKDTKLNLINSINLGYGIRVIRKTPSEIIAIAKEMNADTRFTDKIPTNIKQIFKDGYLPDFIYTVYAMDGDSLMPVGFMEIPFDLADEIYDFKNIDEIRDFFIDIVEDQFGASLSNVSKKIHEFLKIESVAGPFEKIGNDSLTAADILKYYDENSRALNATELKHLNKKVNSLIEKLNSGDAITKNDLESNFVERPSMPHRENVKDYRKMILMAKLNKAIDAVEIGFENTLKSTADEIKINSIKKYYFEIKREITERLSEIDISRDYQSIISDVYGILEKAQFFIKKQ